VFAPPPAHCSCVVLLADLTPRAVEHVDLTAAQVDGGRPSGTMMVPEALLFLMVKPTRMTTLSKTTLLTPRDILISS
jgi:hypothetical protein